MLYVLVNWFTAKTLEDDGPIRVKGGSITIENDVYDWEKDDGEDKNEYHYKGRPNRWNVRVLKNRSICLDWVEARRVKLEVVRGSGKDGTVIFRPNGAVRVLDDQNEFVVTGKKLVDNTPNTRIKKVVIRKLDGSKIPCDFEPNDMCEVAAETRSADCGRVNKSW